MSSSSSKTPTGGGKPSTASRLGMATAVLACALVQGITIGRELSINLFVDDLSLSMKRSKQDVNLIITLDYCIFWGAYILQVIFNCIPRTCFQLLGCKRSPSAAQKAFEDVPITIGLMLWLWGHTICMFFTSNYLVFAILTTVLTAAGSGLLYWNATACLLMILCADERVSYNRFKACCNVNMLMFGLTTTGVLPYFFAMLMSMYIFAMEDGIKPGFSLWSTYNYLHVYFLSIVLVVSCLAMRTYAVPFSKSSKSSDDKYTLTDETQERATYTNDKRLIVLILIALAGIQYSFMTALVWIRPKMDLYELTVESDWVTSLISLGGFFSRLVLLPFLSFFPKATTIWLIFFLATSVICLFTWPLLDIYPKFAGWGFWFGFMTSAVFILFETLITIQWTITPEMKKEKTLHYEAISYRLLGLSCSQTLGNILVSLTTVYVNVIDTNLLIAAIICAVSLGIVTCSHFIMHPDQAYAVLNFVGMGFGYEMLK